MQQIAQINTGERNYTKIQGGTGPLVYGGGHVLVYRVLHAVTNGGENIRLAQCIFIGIYLAALGLVMQCYRQARVPPYIFPLLVLSKRLHSIFLLRLFNDCFAAFFLFLAIFYWQKRYWTAGSLAYSMGLAVKMSLLLALPAVGVLLWQATGRDRALRQAMVMLQLQVWHRQTCFATYLNLDRFCLATHSSLSIQEVISRELLNSRGSSCLNGLSTGGSLGNRHSCRLNFLLHCWWRMHLLSVSL